MEPRSGSEGRILERLLVEAAPGGQVTEQPDSSIRLIVETDHLTVFAVVADSAGSIVTGPTRPIDAFAGFRS